MTGCYLHVIIGAVISCALIFFIIRHVLVLRKISDYTTTLTDINNGNINRRLRCTPTLPELVDFTRAANTYTEQLQHVSIEKLQLEHAQKTMISNISHDLRTPLTSILGYLQMLQADDSLTEPEKSEYLSVANGKSESLYMLLESFFELSKLEAESEAVTSTRLHVREELENAVSTHYQAFRTKNIVPALELPDTPLFAWGNRQYLQRVLDNLLMNALKHGRDAKHIGISAYSADGKVIITVWDTGQGIDEKDIPYIFNRLYMSDESRNRNLGGSGLGLAIVRRLVERLGGEVSARSEPGVRTELTFTLIDASKASEKLQ